MLAFARLESWHAPEVTTVTDTTRTDATELAGTSFEFVVITLDGAALRAEAGEKLVDEVGRAFRNTPTRVILFSVGIGLRSWFLKRSALADTQVTAGGTGLHVHEAQCVTLPPHAGVNAGLLAEADYAYRRRPLPHDFIVTDSAPQEAHDFAALWDGNSLSKCAITPTEAYELSLHHCSRMACELLDWPSVADVDPDDETWLGIEARREVLRLSVYGPTGRTAGAQITAEGIPRCFGQWEHDMLPLNLPEFNRYHHGGKMNRQDRRLIQDVLGYGEAEGAEMPALHALIARLHGDAPQGGVLTPSARPAVPPTGTGLQPPLGGPQRSGPAPRQ
ncbi:hypothetical protein [Streptomyces canus]|uniref:hypothetical protein n=1 Tax=Streptomyces canus TaxID=58343 RepID=UPI00037C6EAD|nr:hypothetical protein [Streptomyces canus]